MPPHDIEALRAHLFGTLAALRDSDNPMDIDRAKAIADVAAVIVDTARVEVKFLETTGALKSTNFLPAEVDPPRPALVSGKRGG